jgi:3'-phosphoadenosine 5'-phosphosulfate (PAPS) 3'-phosphatase
MKQEDLRDIFKKVSNSFCTSTIVASPEPLPPTLSTSSTMMAPENTKEDHDPADNGDIKTEYFIIQHLSSTMHVGIIEF